MKVRFAVHIVIPVLILLFGLSLIAMQYVVSFRFDRNAIHEEARNHVRLVRSRIIQSANEQHELNSLVGLSDDLRSLKGMMGDLELAVVVDESDIVLASSDPQRIKNPLSEIPELSQIASRIINSSQIDGVLSEIDENHRMYGVFPFELAGGNGLSEQSEIVLVGVVLNLQSVLQIMQDKRLAIAAYSGLLLALMTVLLWFFMSRFLNLPLQRLVSTVRFFAKGDFSVSANLTQKNELGEISSLLDSLAKDITESKRQEQDVKLRDRAIEELDVGVSIIDEIKPERPLVYVNRRLCEMSGYSAEQLLGSGPGILRDEKLNIDELRRMNNSIAKGESVQGLLNYQRKDGTAYIGDISLSPVHSADGALTHYIAIVRDITARLETEARLNRAQRIEAIGQLAGGVAHDFNNLLSVIIGNIEFLKQSVSDEEHRHLLNQADVAAQMGARLTRKLLSFAKQDQLEPVVLDANEQVKEAMNLLRTTIGENYQLRFALAGDLWRIRSDPSGIENAVINLSLNARDAMPEGGQILIETCNISLNGGDVHKSLGVLPGDYIQLSVSDSGLGMTQEVKERIFEPFFTTKGVGENTGLGLASTYGFAQQSGGNVLVDSRAGSGAVISLLLPRYDDQSDVRIPTENSRINLAARSSRVLVVEDDEMVRDVTVERLHVMGYLTTQAADGPEAIKLLRQDEHFDLVLTDLVMDGGMSGYDVADWVQQHLPECKVLLTSGYSEKRVHDGHSTIASPPILQKPYKMADLQEAMSALLAGD